MSDPIGVIHGRFQMLHLGHMEYLLAGKARCRRLIVGISNPDATVTRFSSASPHRSQQSANPLTYFERYEMIRGALLESGWADWGQEEPCLYLLLQNPNQEESTVALWADPETCALCQAEVRWEEQTVIQFAFTDFQLETGEPANE